jgi:Ca-activated chloride channel homolog
MIQRAITFFIYTLLTVLTSLAQNENKFIREGNDFYKRNNFAAAEKSYSKSIEKNKESLDAQFNKGDALYKQKKYEDAANLFESLTKKTNDKGKLAQTYHNLGNSLLQNKKYEDCVKAYQNALKLNPKDEDTRYNLAYAKKKLEQQNQQNKNDKNKDNKGNQDQQKQDSQGDKKEEKKDQNQDSKDQKEGKQDEQQQAQQQPQKMNKEDAKRLLEAMNNQEKNVQDKLKKKKAVGAKIAIEKDW